MPYNKDERHTTTTTSVVTEKADYHKHDPTKKKAVGGCLGIVLAILLLGGGFTWFVLGLLRSEDSFSMEGQAMLTTYQQEPLLVSVVSYFRATQVEKRGGSTFRSGSTSYWLTVRKAKGGEVLGKVKLKDVWEPLNPSHIRLLAVENGHVLIQAGTPLRFRLPDLAEGDLQDYAGGGLLPSEARFYLPDPMQRAVWIDLKDGRKAWMDSRTGIIQPLPHPDAPTPPANDEIRNLRVLAGIGKRNYIEFLTWVHPLPGGIMYLLAPQDYPLRSISDRKLQEYFYRDNERVQLIQTTYKESERLTYLEPDEKGKKFITMEGFLQGGFIVHSATNEPLMMEDKYIIAYRSLMGKDGDLKLAWVSYTNGISYEDITVTKADHVKQMLTDESFLLVVAEAQVKGKAGGDEATYIDLATGETDKFDLSPR